MNPTVPDGYFVRFHHYREVVEPDGEISPRGGRTVALILRGDNHETAAIGEARCSPKDNYCKRIGRAIALGRALHKRAFPPVRAANAD